ncbi:Uncharacterised protein [Vibrio cholerae]|nr:Uncharacterised protein [Vibrio cholerae]
MLIVTMVVIAGFHCMKACGSKFLFLSLSSLRF